MVEDYLDSTTSTAEWPAASPGPRGTRSARTVDFVSGRNRYIGYLISLATRSFKGDAR